MRNPEVAEFIKASNKLFSRADSDSWQRREYRDVMNREPGSDVKLELRLISGTRELTLNGSKPIKASLLKAFVA